MTIKTGLSDEAFSLETVWQSALQRYKKRGVEQPESLTRQCWDQTLSNILKANSVCSLKPYIACIITALRKMLNSFDHIENRKHNVYHLVQVFYLESQDLQSARCYFSAGFQVWQVHCCFSVASVALDLDALAQSASPVIAKQLSSTKY